jgi:lipid II:glycine glycyltransferase (peptidoglycan interpeptide bridge formation enzyme)
LLQSWEWGEFKEEFDWEATRYAWKDKTGRPQAVAQILQRTLRIAGISSSARLLYCPRGPSLKWEHQELRHRVLQDLKNLAKDRKAIYLKIEPLIPVAIEGDPFDSIAVCGENVLQTLQTLDWKPSSEQVQFKNTMLLDLRPDEEALLAAMKQKTRYNIRLAGRAGVSVRKGDLEDLDLLYRIYAETSIRDDFVIRQPAYYATAWGNFIRAGIAQPLIAEFEGEAIAAILVYQYGKTATYMYGMSRSLYREKMPNYLLQWEAIRWAKSQGCETYDLWGAPEVLDESDPLWGLYRFKRGFGARYIESIGGWDYIVQPRLYWAYKKVLPKILDQMRARGRRRTSKTLD